MQRNGCPWVAVQRRLFCCVEIETLDVIVLAVAAPTSTSASGSESTPPPSHQKSRTTTAKRKEIGKVLLSVDGKTEAGAPLVWNP